VTGTTVIAYCFSGFLFLQAFFKNGPVFFSERLGEGGVNEAIFNGLQAFVFVL